MPHDDVEKEGTKWKVDANEFIQKLVTDGDLDQAKQTFSKLVEEAPRFVDHMIDALPDGAAGDDAAEQIEAIIAIAAGQSELERDRILSRLEARGTAKKRTLNSMLKQALRDRQTQDEPASNKATETKPTKPKKDEPEWKQRLVTTQAGVPRPVTQNVELILRNDPQLVGMISYDLFQQAVVFRRPPAWKKMFDAARDTAAGSPWTDADDTRFSSYLGRVHELVDVQPQKLQAAVDVVARDQPLHPVRDYLESLSWDAEERLESWLYVYLGGQDGDYASSVGTWWLISAVARVYQPAAKVDHVLVLEGEQGLAKSSALEVLGGQWFSDADLGDLRDKEAALNLQGVWLLELAEGEVFSRASSRTLKAFVTKRRDDLIPKYSNRRTSLPRQCTFALTINEMSDYLADPTGNRRFWPIRCTEIDLKKLQEDRDQLWAEAVHRYKQGEKWWPRTEEEKQLCTEQQSERKARDPWEDRILAGVRAQDKVSVSYVLGTILDVPTERQNRSASLRAANCLRALGWVEGPRTAKARLWVRGAQAAPLVDVGFDDDDDGDDSLGEAEVHVH